MNVVREKHQDAGEESWDGMIADVEGDEVAAGPAALGEDDAVKEDEYEEDNEKGMVCLRTPDNVTIVLMEELPREPGKGRI
ncbi:helicase required for RNAi-mediated heterochromatin assembly 1 [Physcia stellaris]|nr:helicase required for RNAi-mediated heterochromatin assembly 1 [Physcia stellaris]